MADGRVAGMSAAGLDLEFKMSLHFVRTKCNTLRRIFFHREDHMQTIIVLFNLKPDVSREQYEAWARNSDLPVVNALDSVDAFEVLKARGLLIGEGQPSYEYFEIIRVNDMQAFANDLNDPAAQAGAAQFQAYADNPLFILVDAL